MPATESNAGSAGGGVAEDTVGSGNAGAAAGAAGTYARAVAPVGMAKVIGAVAVGAVAYFLEEVVAGGATDDADGAGSALERGGSTSVVFSAKYPCR